MQFLSKMTRNLNSIDKLRISTVGVLEKNKKGGNKKQKEWFKKNCPDTRLTAPALSQSRLSRATLVKLSQGKCYRSLPQWLISQLFIWLDCDNSSGCAIQRWCGARESTLEGHTIAPPERLLTDPSRARTGPGTCRTTGSRDFRGNEAAESLVECSDIGFECQWERF